MKFMYQGQHQQNGIVRYFCQYVKKEIGKIRLQRDNLFNSCCKIYTKIKHERLQRYSETF